ncbi:DgyrCDS4762 [Dimorphilus gyrociliatus]|uniref:DgyrCDS4762 n=1 Tax=Dimorphilus gyrociliatus TaxID=2664684 RepID=A0A7I8VHZ1_9ANNE|nr:DgyrCDS4762 [Dimorphilus gyrociliatus]
MRKSTANRRSTPKQPGSARSKDEISLREEEYKRLNAELEAKTAKLVEEAEAVIAQDYSVVSDTKQSLLSKIDSDDLLEWDEDALSTRRPRSNLKKSNKSYQSDAEGDIFVTETRDEVYRNAIEKLQNQSYDENETIEDVMPEAAGQMGSEAQIRFLKAKAKAMQEELDILTEECSNKKEENTELASKLKTCEEELSRSKKSLSSHEATVRKLNRIIEESSATSERLNQELSSLKSEYDQLTRSQKKMNSEQGAVEIRLRRALEEVEKYKSEINRAKSARKESTEADKRRMNELTAENRKLEKQKNELMIGFKKQMKLIDILKRQKMHLEAARMLAFTEEEFVKALDWEG